MTYDEVGPWVYHPFFRRNTRYVLRGSWVGHQFQYGEEVQESSSYGNSGPEAAKERFDRMVAEDQRRCAQWKARRDADAKMEDDW